MPRNSLQPPCIDSTSLIWRLSLPEYLVLRAFDYRRQRPGISSEIEQCVALGNAGRSRSIAILFVLDQCFGRVADCLHAD